MGNWYIIQTNPQCEKRAAANIRRYGHRVYLPKLSKLHIHRRTKEKSVKYRPLLVGYLFARMDRYDPLFECQGVKTVVRNASGVPYVLPEDTVPKLIRAQRMMHHEAEDVRTYRMGLRRGHRKSFDRAIAETLFGDGGIALIVAGPFAGHDVEVVGITDSGRVRATFELLGKHVEKAFEPLMEIVPVSKDVVEIPAAA